MGNRTIRVKKLEDLKNHFSGLALILATANLKYHGFYKCLTDGHKTDIFLEA